LWEYKLDKKSVGMRAISEMVVIGECGFLFASQAFPDGIVVEQQFLAADS
jgi:hypothetical protein